MRIFTMNFFETASFHIVKPCNMKCKFCYATFEDMHVTQLTKEEAFIILDKLKNAGLQKITFAGGEPLLYKYIRDVIIYSKQIGLTTSIVTNGSLIDHTFLQEMKSYLDWIGISVDSLFKVTNESIGRKVKWNINYFSLINEIKSYGYKLKINTVVNAYNYDEDLNSFIQYAQPMRWKVFQTLKVEGQNDKQFSEIKCTDEQFSDFTSRHKSNSCIVPENNEAMTASYLLIDPQGRLFENSKGAHTYSSPLQNNEMEKCLSQINLNREMFIKRGGIYQW
jgi:radical S-adenosyl methionine domain-containing protein 2